MKMIMFEQNNLSLLLKSNCESIWNFLPVKPISTKDGGYDNDRREGDSGGKQDETIECRDCQAEFIFSVGKYRISILIFLY